MQNVRQRRLRRALLGAFAGALALTLGLYAWAGRASSASLSATPATPRQNDTVTLVGSGFSPGETVSVWITYPDLSVFGVAEIATNGDGAFNFPYLPDFLGATFTPTGRYTYTAFGQSSGREVYAVIDVAIDQAPGTSAGVALTATPGRDGQGAYFVFRGSGYRGGEEVAVWIRNPDNTVADLGRISAGPGGELEYVLSVEGAAVGRYALTARGLDGGANGIAEFDVRVNDLTFETGRAVLAISPSADTQRSEAVFTGSGFQPSEIVTIWVTLPDYSTRWIGDVQADGDGAFNATLYLSEQQPVGARTYTAYGNLSGVQGLANFTLQPGGGPDSNPFTGLTADAFCTGEGCITP
jgi:hypothetical protein